MLVLLLTPLASATPPARIAQFVDQDGRCRWEAMAIDPVGEPTTLAEFPVPCRIGALRVAPGGKRALVEMSVRGADGGPVLYEVNLTSGAVTSFAPVPVPHPSAWVGYGEDGLPRVYAVVAGTPGGGTPEQPATLSFAGRTWPVGVSVEGPPELAVEYRRGASGWEFVDGAITETGFCGARRASALPSYGPTMARAAWDEPPWEPVPVADAAALALASGEPKERFREGMWLIQRGEGGALAQWSDEYESYTGSSIVLVQLAAGWSRLPVEAADGSGATLRRRGPYVLVNSDAWELPTRVYDLRDGELVWTSTSGVGPAWAPN